MAYIFNHNPLEMYPYIIWLLFPGCRSQLPSWACWLSMSGTDLVPAMGLGIEPPERGIIDSPPRRRDMKLLSIGFILQNLFRPRHTRDSQLLRDLPLFRVDHGLLAARTEPFGHAPVT